MLVYGVLGAFAIGVAVLPGLVAFARPPWMRAVIGVGAALSLAVWAVGWVGGTGDMDREGTIALMGFYALAALIAWTVGALLGRRLKRRLSRGETRLA
jgi:hypothetical protein